MRKRLLLVALSIFLLIMTCGIQTLPSVEEDAPPASQPESAEPAQEAEPLPTPEAGSEDELVPSDCLNGEISPIGSSIADEYDFTNYEEVITWFCNGAEFEDILVALETESQVDTPAEDMLQMLADGFTWDEIWQLEGLTD